MPPPSSTGSDDEKPEPDAGSGLDDDPSPLESTIVLSGATTRPARGFPIPFAGTAQPPPPAPAPTRPPPGRQRSMTIDATSVESHHLSVLPFQAEQPPAPVPTPPARVMTPAAASLPASGPGAASIAASRSVWAGANRSARQLEIAEQFRSQGEISAPDLLAGATAKPALTTEVVPASSGLDMAPEPDTKFSTPRNRLFARGLAQLLTTDNEQLDGWVKQHITADSALGRADAVRVRDLLAYLSEALRGGDRAVRERILDMWDIMQRPNRP